MLPHAHSLDICKLHISRIAFEHILISNILFVTFKSIFEYRWRDLKIFLVSGTTINKFGNIKFLRASLQELKADKNNKTSTILFVLKPLFSEYLVFEYNIN